MATREEIQCRLQSLAKRKMGHEAPTRDDILEAMSVIEDALASEETRAESLQALAECLLSSSKLDGMLSELHDRKMLFFLEIAKPFEAGKKGGQKRWEHNARKKAAEAIRLKVDSYLANHPRKKFSQDLILELMSELRPLATSAGHLLNSDDVQASLSIYRWKEFGDLKPPRGRPKK